MPVWSKHPLFRLLCAFVTGILAAYYAVDSILPFYIALPAIVIIIITGYYIVSKHKQHTYRFSAILLICFVLLGIIHTQTFRYLRQQVPDDIHNSSSQNFILLVNEIPIEKEKSIKIIGKITQMENQNKWMNANTKILLYLQKDSMASNLQYGDKLLISTKINEISGPKNPDEFNYKRYLNLKNIYYQAYCKGPQWHLLAHRQGNAILRVSAHLRNVFLRILQQSGLEVNEYSVIAAMLLGFDDNMDAELSRQYASAGASHILCVSGMHVGIIYLIINFLLSFLDKRKYGKQLKSILTLAGIWLYACITGLSPSVMRAATMFTFVSIGQLFQQQNNTYNSLLASMFFLLMINPLLIFDIGFQFSYLAVFGILWIVNLMKDYIHIDNPVAEYFVGIICVSVVAQLFTAPLSMYYFHRFPNYFLLTNTVVVGIAPFIIGCGIIVLCTYWIPPLFTLFSHLLSWMIKMVNACIAGINSLPGSSTTGIAFSITQTIILYLIILCTLIFLIYKHKRYIWTAFGALILFFCLELKCQIKLLRREEIVFYHTPSSVVIDYFYGKNCYNYCTDEQSLAYSDFACNNHRCLNRIKNIYPIQDRHYFQLGNYSCLVLDTLLIPLDTPCLKVDFLVLGNNQNYHMDAIQKSIDFDMLIIDNDFSPYRREKLLQQCDRLHIAYHDLSWQALVVKLP
ncbi:MAG: ComEC/Rec2 family competence protein [Bacteroidales bacterium]|nr:ComEC/Rec2 family competence protein [Bacteroidales bacterium]